MKIVLCGVQTINKGAELMLYAMIQEVERKYPNATIYLPDHLISQPVSYIQSNMDIRKKPIAKIRTILEKYKIASILRKLHIYQYLIDDFYPIRNADYFFDASGFHFSDQFEIPPHRMRRWHWVLRNQKKQNTKIIFLPQAFGPVQKNTTKKVLSYLKQYSDLVIAREPQSMQYLLDAGFCKEKVRMFTDFTSLVEGTFPVGYEHLKGGVCIIPNKQMVNKGVITMDSYIKLLTDVIESAKNSSRRVYLLNHEGTGDMELAMECKKIIGDDIEVVDGLNALEVKGLIASAYLCITGRYHGLASALNCCVPCLATSWSHKYSALYADYGLDGCLLPLNDIDGCLKLIDCFLEQEQNEKIRQLLSVAVPKVQQATRNMWDVVWSL